MKSLGIDPGKKGYACLLDEGNDYEAHFWPACVDPITQEYCPVVMADLARKEWGDADVVILEQQAPRRHGSGSAGREGTVSSWTNGYGFGLWVGILRARSREASVNRALAYLVIVDPNIWKRRMGALASHKGEDTQHARRKSADQASIKIAQRLGPQIDFRPVERASESRVPSPDKSCAFLLACYGMALLKGKAQEEK
jgi:hypothetical protein